MALLATSADYTDKDFDALLARLRSTIVSVFPTWTDDEVANFGNILVEMYCFVGDVLTYYQDNQAAESRIATATQRRNLLALARLLGYVPTTAAAATVDVRFTLSAPVQAGRTVTFHPPGPPAPASNPTTVRTSDPENQQSFQLLADVVIAAGGTTGTGTCEHSTLQDEESFTSTGLPDQEVLLANTPYLGDTAVVEADNGVYTEVANFLASGVIDRHYTVTVDDNDQATLRFGDGVSGAIPVGTIVVQYRTGGGATGNVAAGAISTIDGSFVDSNGDAVTVAVTNLGAASGGADRETDESIRTNAPLSISALTRTVSREDFEVNGRQVLGVQRALMVTRDEDGTMAENTGTLHIIPAGGGFPTTTLKNQVLAKVTVEKPCTLTFAPSVAAPWYLDIGVNAVLFLRAGYDAANVRADIIVALQEYFALLAADGTDNPNVDFGWNIRDAYDEPLGLVPLSAIYNVVNDVEGVLRIGSNTNDFRLVAYRVLEANDAYTGGSNNATLIQALAHSDVPQGIRDFPRLKTTVLGGAIPDVTLNIDGTPFPPG